MSGRPRRPAPRRGRCSYCFCLLGVGGGRRPPSGGSRAHPQSAALGNVSSCWNVKFKGTRCSCGTGGIAVPESQARRARSGAQTFPPCGREGACPAPSFPLPAPPPAGSPRTPDPPSQKQQRVLPGCPAHGRRCGPEVLWLVRPRSAERGIWA